MKISYKKKVHGKNKVLKKKKSGIKTFKKNFVSREKKIKLKQKFKAGIIAKC